MPVFQELLLSLSHNYPATSDAEATIVNLAPKPPTAKPFPKLEGKEREGGKLFFMKRIHWKEALLAKSKHSCWLNLVLV